MKKALWISFAIGLVLGIAQIYWVRDVTYPNDDCPYAIVNGSCVYPLVPEKQRGFPLSGEARDDNGDATIPPQAIANIVIFALGLPLITYIVIRIKRLLSARAVKK